ncbi:MAG: DNA ligase D, partial [Chloroflexota bacterium]|nr:DNA ligase D [Chloroflexota bacterium]
MSLDLYRRKRDFAITPEPSGALQSDDAGASRAPESGRRFVVQRHRATRLHYDLRLEIDGVLMSWAVPKGPTLDPDQRRMAVHVEDHPLEYFDFEGIIPRGRYGAGDVIVWDWGTFQPEETDDPGAAVRSGELKFRLDGQKLVGRYTLVRIRSKDPEEDAWLLIHKRDESAVAGWDAGDHLTSVKTGLSNEEVAAGRAPPTVSTGPENEPRPGVEATMPAFIPPMRATAVDRVFSDPDWLYELKLDGYRVEAVVVDGDLRLWTRNRQDAARYFPDLAATPPDWIAASSAIVDGEVVSLDEQGRSDFSRLQDRTGMRGLGTKRGERRARKGTERSAAGDEGALAPLVYFIFDLLYLNGRSLLDVPLEERKRILKGVLRQHPRVRYVSHIEAEGEAFFAAAKERGLEGIVAKLRRSRYEPDRRSNVWLKIKIRQEQELVVGGYEPGQGTHMDLGSLIVGVYAGKRLVFAGHVGSGMDARTRRSLVERLEALRVVTPPFADPPPIRAARWAEPRIVIRAAFAEWTRDGLLRQAAYKGEAIDRDPASVVRERPVPSSARVEAAERESIPVSSVPAGDAPDDRGSDPPQAATEQELAELDSMGKAGSWQVGGHRLNLTNLDKTLFPGAGATKRDLIRYYVTMAPILLPYLRARPLNTDRWPDGVTGKHFWQKQIPKHAPDWMARWDYPEAGSTESHTYIVADRVATMAWLANQAVIDLHPWTSRCESYRNPTYALIDIDPGERTTFEQVVALAQVYRTALGHLGVTGFAKVTGKRGIQIWVP